MLLAAPLIAGAAFGISPPFINAQHLVRGAKYSQVVYLVQDQPNQTLPIKTAIDVDENIRSWITIDKGLNFEIPQGVRQFPVEITIQVPQDTPLGLYRGKISFTSDTARNTGGQDGQVSIALGVQVDLNLTVGEGVYEQFSVPVVKLLDIEEGWDPKVYFKLNNEGNVPERFTGATYELFDQFGGTRLAFGQKTEGFPETPPFTVGEHTIDFPLGFRLGIGQYWGNVKFYQNDTLVASQKTIFNVLERGSLSTPTAQVIDFLRNQWPWMLALVIAILAGLLFARRRRASRRASATS